MFYLLLFTSLSLYSTESALPPLDYDALTAMQLYQKLNVAPQELKDKDFEEHCKSAHTQGHYNKARLHIACALLAGANPNICSDGLRNAINEYDGSLVALHIKNNTDPHTIITSCWAWCDNQKKLNFLTENGIPLLDISHNLTAFNEALVDISCDINTIHSMLKQYPELAKGLPGHPPILRCSCKQNENIINGSKKELLQLFVDHGASPHDRRSYGNTYSSFDHLLQKGYQINYERHAQDREFAKWLLQYYHLRTDYIPQVFGAIVKGLKGHNMPPTIIHHILKHVGFEDAPNDLLFESWHGPVPEAYINFRNAALELPIPKH